MPFSIYTITNTKTGTVYVGQTEQEPQKRWNKHKCMLVTGTWGGKNGRQFQDDWYNQPPKDFEFTVIETTETEREARKRERYWINYYPEVYNVWGRYKDAELRARYCAGVMSRAPIGNGAGSFASKLSKADVAEIRTLLGQLPCGEVARLYGVSHTLISLIWTGKRHENVTV